MMKQKCTLAIAFSMISSGGTRSSRRLNSVALSIGSILILFFAFLFPVTVKGQSPYESGNDGMSSSNRLTSTDQVEDGVDQALLNGELISSNLCLAMAESAPMANAPILRATAVEKLQYHQQGHSGRPYIQIVNGDSIQSVHTERIIYYMARGTTRRLELPEKSFNYIRWYNYDTDETIAAGTATYNGKFKPLRYGMGYAWYKANANSNDTSTACITYTYPNDVGVVTIAADLSYYTDLTRSGDTVTREPTLSQRILFEIHPASEMVTMLSPYSNSTGAVDSAYMENYTIEAPASNGSNGVVLFLGPAYKFYGPTSYFIDSVTPVSNYQLYENGVPVSTSTPLNGQFFSITNLDTAGTLTYTLLANDYGLAKFTIKLKKQSIVGPSETGLISDSTLINNYKYIAGLRFNQPDFIPLDWDESGYGFYYADWGYTSNRPSGDRQSVYWGEYALMNVVSEKYSNFLVTGIRDMAYQKTGDMTSNFLYVDANNKPGKVVDLKFSEGSLCPGSKMYVSAWLNDLNKENKTKPNLNLIVIGLKSDSTYDVLKIFTTGDLSSSIAIGTWRQVRFEVDVPNVDYTSFRLRIVNNAQSAIGNDFGIDDISIYIQKAAFTAYPSRLSCGGTTDVNVLMVKIAAQSVDFPIEDSVKTIYYRFLDAQNNTITLKDYLNTPDDTYGVIEIPQNKIPEDIIYTTDSVSTGLYKYQQARLAYLSGSSTVDPGRFFCVHELVDTDYVNNFYVLHTYDSSKFQNDSTYECVIATDPSSLSLQSTCGLVSEFVMSNKNDLLLNNEAVGSTVDDVCSDSYNELRVRLYGNTQSLSELLQGNCKCDWLVGSAQEFNNAGYLYDSILVALETFREAYPSNSTLTGVAPTGSFTTNQFNLLDTLVKNNLLILYKEVIYRNAMVNTTYYVAVPVPGTAYVLDSDVPMNACLSPIPLTLNSAATDYMFNVGEISVTGIPDSVLNNRIVRWNASTVNSDQLVIPIRDLISSISSSELENCKLYLLPSTTDNRDVVPINDGITPEPVYGTVSVDSLDNQIKITFSQRKAGFDYQPGYRYDCLVLLNSGDGCGNAARFQLVILPDFAMWHPTAGSYSWHVDDNWLLVDSIGTVMPSGQGFVPGRGTNVIIAKGATLPELKEPTPVTGSVMILNDLAQPGITYDLYFEANRCKTIYVMKHAMLSGQDALEYDSAWVDMPLKTNSWNLIAPPFEEMVVGDMYIPSSGSETNPIFTPVDSPNSRKAYEFFTSLYNSTGVQVDRNGDTTLVRMATWSTPFNALNTPVETAQGYSVNVLGQGEDTVVVRLPKRDKVYYYYGTYGERTNLSETIARSDNGSRLASTNGLTLTTNFSNKIEPRTYQLVANPYLAELDIRKFLLDADNSNYLTTTYAMISPTDRSMVTYDIAGSLSSQGDSVPFFIPPMTSFMVQLIDSSQNVTIELRPDMLRNYTDTSSTPAPVASASIASRSILLIEAAWNGNKSSCVVVEEPTASRQTLCREDSYLLLLRKAMTPGAIYSHTNQVALAINRVPSLQMIPLGFASYTDGDEPVTLTFKGVDEFSEPLELFDAVTNQSTLLTEGLQLTLPYLKSNATRYFIRHYAATTGGTDATNDNSELVQVYQPTNGDVVVTCSGVMNRVCVYGVSGQLVDEHAGLASSREEFHLSSGVYIVEVMSEYGAIKEKVVIR